MLRRSVSWLTSAALLMASTPLSVSAQQMVPKGAPMMEPVQSAPPPGAMAGPGAMGGPGAPMAPQVAIYGPEQLEAILAPIALYPDALLTQVLMASAFPLQLVEASRWAEANRGITGPALERALTGRNWDPSVKSLVQFPAVLAQMTANLDWLQDLGAAAVQQQADVLDAVQRLRQRAAAAGNLRTTEQSVVRTEQQFIYIEPAQPQLVYVPAYNPTEVYGGWAYPAYPPAYLPPPVGYGWEPVVGAALAFGAGIAVGAALWNVGRTNWGGHNIYVNQNVYNNINVGRGGWRGDTWQPRQAHSFNQTAFVNHGGGNAPWRGPDADRVQNYRANQFGGTGAGGAGGNPVYRSNQFGTGGGQGGNQYRYNNGGQGGGGGQSGNQYRQHGYQGQGGQSATGQGGAGSGTGGSGGGQHYRGSGAGAGAGAVGQSGGQGGGGGGGGGQFRGGGGGGGGNAPVIQSGGGGRHGGGGAPVGGGGGGGSAPVIQSGGGGHHGGGGAPAGGGGGGGGGGNNQHRRNQNN